jgi:hypothetical protein
VKKFTNRKIATERIWKAIQHLGGATAAAQECDVVANVGAQVADVAPAEAKATKQASPKKGTREGSKTALDLVRQSGGAASRCWYLAMALGRDWCGRRANPRSRCTVVPVARS